MRGKSAMVMALLSAALFAAPQIQAQTPPQPATGSSSAPAPELKPELQPLAFFAGQWDCDGEFVASKKPIQAHISIAPDLDGSWLIFRWDDKAPNRFHAVEFWGYNKTAKHFSNFIYDNFGGARLFESKGWDADTLIWAGDMLPAASGAASPNQPALRPRTQIGQGIYNFLRYPQAPGGLVHHGPPDLQAEIAREDCGTTDASSALLNLSHNFRLRV